MIIVTITSGPFQTNGYLVGNPETHVAIAIDVPPESVEDFVNEARMRQLAITQIIHTHGHWDHVADSALLKARTTARIFIHKLDETYLLHPQEIIEGITFQFDPVLPDGYLDDGTSLTNNSIELNVIHTPGHTPGSACFFFPNELVLFSGDTLFAGSVGRADLPGGDWELLLSSIRTKLFKLPEETRVYPGHGPITTIQQEKLYNPFVGTLRRPTAH
ncbi:MAG: MBL fold metallo-hydrolase [Bacteroidota bacterium]